MGRAHSEELACLLFMCMTSDRNTYSWFLVNRVNNKLKLTGVEVHNSVYLDADIIYLTNDG